MCEFVPLLIVSQRNTEVSETGAVKTRPPVLGSQREIRLTSVLFPDKAFTGTVATWYLEVSWEASSFVFLPNVVVGKQSSQVMLTVPHCSIDMTASSAIDSIHPKRRISLTSKKMKPFFSFVHWHLSILCNACEQIFAKDAQKKVRRKGTTLSSKTGQRRSDPMF